MNASSAADALPSPLSAAPPQASAEEFTPPAPAPPARDLPGPLLLLALRQNSLRAWPARAYRELLVHRRFLGTDCYLVSDPLAARHVLSEGGANYVRPVSARRLMRHIAGAGVLIAEGAEWRRHRRMLAPAYTPRHVEDLIPQFTAAAADMLKELEGQSQVKLGLTLERAAIDGACRAIFSIPLGVQAASRIAALQRSYFSHAGRAQFFDFLARSDGDYPWFTRRRAAFSRRWFAEIDALIAQRRNRASTADTSDLFELLTAAHDPSTGTPPNDEDLRNQISASMTAGSETTARAMFWTVYLLAHAPNWQATIRRELHEFSPSALSSIRDLDRWPSLRAVLLETLRLYPPVSVVSRVPLADDSISGTPVRAGSLVMVSPWIMHRHRRLWDEPEAFYPERFLHRPQAFVLEPAYIPFGAGPRSCPGGAFAIAEASIVLAHLLARFEVAMVTERPVMPVAVVTTMPDHEPWFSLRPN